MKRTTSDIVMTVLKLIILSVITLYTAYCLFCIANVEPAYGVEVFVFVILVAASFYVNGGAFLASLVLFILSIVFKNAFVSQAAKTGAEDYEKRLKVKKRQTWHYGFLMAYAVIAECLILFLGVAVL